MKKLPIPNKKDLYQSYIVEGSSISSIAKSYKTGNAVVRNWLNYHDIKRRSHHEACLKVIEKKIKDIPTKDELEHYDEQLTEVELMKLNGYDRIWDCGHNIYVWRK